MYVRNDRNSEIFGHFRKVGVISKILSMRRILSLRHKNRERPMRPQDSRESCDFIGHFLYLWRSFKIRRIGRIFDIYWQNDNAKIYESKLYKFIFLSKHHNIVACINILNFVCFKLFCLELQAGDVRNDTNKLVLIDTFGNSNKKKFETVNP